MSRGVRLIAQLFEAIKRVIKNGSRHLLSANTRGDENNLLENPCRKSGPNSSTELDNALENCHIEFFDVKFGDQWLDQRFCIPGSRSP